MDNTVARNLDNGAWSKMMGSWLWRSGNENGWRRFRHQGAIIKQIIVQEVKKELVLHEVGEASTNEIGLNTNGSHESLRQETERVRFTHVVLPR